MSNPFFIDGYRGTDSFCNRKKELSTIAQNVHSGVHTTIVSFRRMGKTALIQRAFDQLSKRTTQTILIDIEATHNLGQFNAVLATGIARALYTQRRGVSKHITEILQRLRASVALDAVTLQPSVEFSFGPTSPSARQSLDELLAILEEHPKRVVLAIDEFQQVASYDGGLMEQELRSRMQQLRNISFVFAGSKKDMMTTMFSDGRRPFYHSTSMLGLTEITASDWESYIVSQFATSKRHISESVVARVLEVSYRHTFYVLLLCNRLWNTGEKRLKDPLQVDAVLHDLTQQMEVEFFTYRNLLASGQWSLLSGIGIEGLVSEPTAQAFMSKYNLNSSAAVTKALAVLLDRELVLRRDDGLYRVYNPFFSWWAQRRLMF